MEHTIPVQIAEGGKMGTRKMQHITTEWGAVIFAQRTIQEGDRQGRTIINVIIIITSY
jgi:hypothetical protein